MAGTLKWVPTSNAAAESDYNKPGLNVWNGWYDYVDPTMALEVRSDLNSDKWGAYYKSGAEYKRCDQKSYSTTLKQVGGVWTVEKKNGYPAMSDGGPGCGSDCAGGKYFGNQANPSTFALHTGYPCTASNYDGNMEWQGHREQPAEMGNYMRHGWEEGELFNGKPFYKQLACEGQRKGYK